jgi:Tol biopolymer transport system component
LLETVGQPQNMAQPALSPDGQRVAVRSNESGNNDIWVHDLIRSTKTRLTFEDRGEAHPAWSPSGQEIAYRQGRRLMRKAADGTGAAIVLVESESDLFGPSWSHDGRYLVYSENNSETQRDIRYVELGTDGEASEPVAFLSTPANERFPKLSPDGRCLTYQSDESGGTEIYVQSFPDGASKWQVSVNGGDQISWSGDGSELFYAEGLTLMAVSVSTKQGFTLGQPQMLFASPDLVMVSGGGRSYDVSADNQRFVMTAPIQEGDDGEVAPPSIRVVENWYEEFRDRE